MRNDFSQEKRQSKRYLCDEFFTQLSLHTLEGNIDMTAIDFSKEGIGLFTSDIIPVSGDVSLSLQYKNPSLSYEFAHIPCAIVHCNLTEVGSHCGVFFKTNEISQTDKIAFSAIEAHLIKCEDPDDRYHLLSDS